MPTWTGTPGSGDLGGVTNLTATGTVTGGTVASTGGASVAGDLSVSGNASVTGNATVTGTLGVTGATTATEVRIDDGAVNDPKLTFTNDPDTGFYRIGTGAIGVASDGALVVQLDGSGTAALNQTIIGKGLLTLHAVRVQIRTTDGRYLQIYPSTADTSQFFQVIPKGSPADVVKAVMQLFGTDFVADATNYEATELVWENIALAALGNLTGFSGMLASLNTFQGGTGTQRQFAILLNAVVGMIFKRLSSTRVEVCQSAPNTAPTDGDIPNEGISFYLDESTNTLKVRAKYTDGTLKTGSVALA